MRRLRKYYFHPDGIDSRIWGDERFRSLNAVQGLIALYALIRPSKRGPKQTTGQLDARLAWRELHMPIEIFMGNFIEVCRTMDWHFNIERNVLVLSLKPKKGAAR